MDVRTASIILIGPSGVGKTLFINGLINHLKYESLNEALNNFIECPAPLEFPFEDEFEKELVVRFGPETERDYGMMDTSECKLYQVEQLPLMKVQVVDTPPIEDCESSDQTTKNVNSIVEYICNMESLHAICIFFRANEAKENMAFGGLQRFLARLPISVLPNVCFILTFASSSMYNPGNTGPVIQEFMRKIQARNENATFGEKPKIFCLDNEGLKYAMAVKQNIKPKEISEMGCSESWLKSRNAYADLIDYVSSLNQAPKAELCTFARLHEVDSVLKESLTHLNSKIGPLLEETEKREKTIEDGKRYLDDLETQKYRTILVDECQKTARPRVVCTNEKCRFLRGQSPGPLLTRKCCHRDCSCKAYKCSSFTNGICYYCGCGEEYHLYSPYHLVTVEKRVEDEVIREKIANTTATLANYKVGLQKMTSELDCLFQTYEAVQSVANACHWYYQQNAIINTQERASVDEICSLPPVNFTFELLREEIENLEKFNEISNLLDSIKCVLWKSTPKITKVPVEDLSNFQCDNN